MRFVFGAVLWLLVAAASAATFTVSSSVYPSGARDIGLSAVVLPTDTWVEARFSREAWPTSESGIVIDGRIYVSIDGGPPQYRCGFTAQGGDIFYVNGTLSTYSSVGCSIPSGTVRTVTITMQNSLQLSTAVTVITQ